MDGESQGPVEGNLASDIGTGEAGALIADLLDPNAAPVKEPEPKPEPNAQEEGGDAVVEKPVEEKMFTVTIDGKDVSIPESELINGYKAQKSSTEKYEAAAALRKQADAETQKARQDRHQYASGLQQNQALLQAALTEQNKIDWHALREQDPVEFLKQQHLLNERQAALHDTRQRLENVAAVERDEQAKSLEDHLAGERQALLDKLPDWKDEAKAKVETAKLIKFLVDDWGYTPDQIISERDAQGRITRPGVTDHRALLMARESMLYREMMSKAKAAAQKVEALPKRVERPGGGETVALDKRGAAFQRLSKSGNPRDAASLMASFL